MSILASQPRSLTELLAASFDLYTESFTKVIGYSLLITTFNHLLGILATQAIPTDTTLDQEAQLAALMQAMPTLITVFIISMLVYCLFGSATIYRVNNVANGQEDDFFSTLLLPLKKVPTLFLAWMLYIIAVTIGSFLLVIPGIILMLSLLFCSYLILLEDKGAFDALATSHSLVWGNWWRTFLVFLVPGVIFLVVFFIFGFITGLILASQPAALNIISELLGAMVAPYFTALMYLQYHDLKLRKI